MSNDELTPEEREALAHLPRERTPSAGLEDRVVAAMREHGHLARKPARVIRLTTSRVAGLLAACLVLMIMLATSVSPWYVWTDLKGGTVEEYATR